MVITMTELKENMRKYIELSKKEDIIITKNGKTISKITKATNDKKKKCTDVKEDLMHKNDSCRRVITYGTFDLLHYGHINLLRRAKALGDYLVVAISSDEFNAIKGKTSFFKYEERKAILEAIKYVDEVIPENDWEQKRSDMHKYNIDVFVMGDDWKGKFDFLTEEGVEVVYLPRTPDISTTQIKQGLKK